MNPEDLGISDVGSVYQAGGWFAVCALAVLLVVRTYRAGWVQAILPAAVRWDTLPKWVRFTVVWFVSFIPAVLGAMHGGVPVSDAIMQAFAIAGAATGAHKVTKAAGHRMTHAAVQRDPGYKPGAARKAASIIVPLDKRVV